ncbi:hydroxypyruvate isomerase family protein [Amycolatopsis jiangsuensis]|uniref:Hydroxypyruvate isomerase n=2 Tax=Amycolatopsis jiangsuensis TaxID=1181879 RepID=A0A840IN77_9PSEU|nr:TIM barrel protein [Amycolatopsis jiangsuensis]MBB4683400.1 hydroxypyruvate isomerase [Amycolatopsis jiangsuensis]
MAERIGSAIWCGFTAIEHPAPYSVPAAEMAGWLRSAGARYVQLGLYSGDASKGEKGLGIFPDRRAEFRESVTQALDYAEAVGASMVHAMAGVLPRAQRAQQHWDCYVENLAFAAREAAPRGIKIIVEAMSETAVPEYFFDAPDQAARAIGEAGEENIGLLLDVFHTVSAGLAVEQEIAKHAALLAHVHIADVPGRHEPGSGTVDFDQVKLALRKANYDGFLGCEYSPIESTEAGLGWLRP